MKPTIFLLGPSDRATQTPAVGSVEGDVPVNSGAASEHLCIPLLIRDDATLRIKSEFLNVNGLQQVRFPKDAPKNVNFFNLVCDADASAEVLKTIERLEHQIQPSRFFNRTIDVMKTSRGAIGEALANIPGCRVPRVKASNATSLAELESACEELAAWPLIVRARGYHAGKNMRLVRDGAELRALEKESWIYCGVWLIEFIDYLNSENLYQKTRVVFVDGSPYPRHSIFATKWNVHAASRADLMDDDGNLRRREHEFLDYLRDGGLQRYGDAFSAIQERIGLDVFGIDFALVGGEIVVFEANACMQFLHQDYGRDGRYRYLESHIRAIKRAIKTMLMHQA